MKRTFATILIGLSAMIAGNAHAQPDNDVFRSNDITAEPTMIAAPVPPAALAGAAGLLSVVGWQWARKRRQDR